ncbi:MAG: phosphodiester glycosidase family protein [Oscillospiraceae bacterium]|nr:phosphodiester glycosidase family protein [Oscillospiraceae bacterium]
MSKRNTMPDYDPVPSQRGGASKQSRKKKKKGSGLFGRIVRRFFLVLFTVIALILVAACLALNLIFNGPSPAARDVLTMSLLEPSGTKWIPGLFMDAETLDSIRTREDSNLTDEFSNTSEIVINKDAAISTGTDEWANSPDGIRFESHSGDTYNAHIMIVRDPSKVYLGTSTENFSTSIPGTRIDDQIETDGAIAGVNAGAFFDNGTSDPAVGSVPEGLVYSKGVCKWTTGSPPNGIKGFAGFNKDNILVVAQDNLSKAQAEELNIRDGCCFGPVLIMNGEINQEAYNSNSGWNPRTAVGQRKDGAVVFVCIDGRQAGSAGGTYKDVIDIMIEYGVVNACNMDGGSSSIMVYRDTYGLFGEAGTVQVINSYSLLQERPRKMPTFWMVAP